MYVDNDKLSYSPVQLLFTLRERNNLSWRIVIYIALKSLVYVIE